MQDTIEEVRILLAQVFTTTEAVEEWLDTPEVMFQSRTPRQELAVTGGEIRVIDLVKRVVHGIPP